jgi:PadR family transcriptional regulator AphA
MDLHSAILGLLNRKPCSGYDLKRTISNSEIFYWSGNNNQIYKGLLELEQQGQVTHQVQYQESLPARKIYAVTEKGLAALRASLRAAPDLPETHKGFLIQLACADSLSDEEIQGLLDQYAAELADRLRMLQEQAARAAGEPSGSGRQAYLQRRITDNLIAACQTELDWARQTQPEFRDGKISA